MRRLVLQFTGAGLAAVTALCVFALVACAGQGAGSAASSEAAEEAAATAEEKAAEEQATREQIQAVLERARLKTFDTVTVKQTVETTASGQGADGQNVTQSATTTMTAEIRNNTKDPAIHMFYESYASNQPGRVAYDMFINKDSFYVVQGEQLYTDAAEKSTASEYIASMFSIVSEEQVNALLDVASGFKLQETNGDTAVSITVDVSKLASTDLIDVSSLPEGTDVATLVVSYVVDPDDYLKTVRLMSATTGAPTYRVNQRYEFGGYDDTELPEWPDLAAYAQKNADIQYDDEGNMYIVGEDGVTYYIDSFEPDGTVKVHTNEPSQEEAEALQAQQQAQEQAAAAAASQTRRRTSSGSGKANASASAQAASASSAAAEPSDAASDIGNASFTEGDASETEDSSIDDASFIEGDSSGADTSSTSASGSDSSAGTSGSTSSDTGSGTGSASAADTTQTTAEQGRAYITAYDGTVHYLDEPGSEIRNIGGSRVFIDANGEWYFLNEE